MKDRIHSYFKILLIISLFNLNSCYDQDDRFALLQINEFPNREKDFSFWQLEQFNQEVQMAYLLRTDDGNITVIDGGLASSAGILEDFLIQLGGEVQTWILTHPHKDHIGALKQIIPSGRIVINRIIHSEIDLEKIKVHEPKSFELAKDYYSILKDSKIEVIDAKLSERYSIGNGVELEILGNKNENILVNLVNNSSLVFKIKSESKSVLFLGDLGVEGGQEILENTAPKLLKADYVQMAHHGQDGVAKNFYAMVNPQYALWPTPSWLWENNMEARGYNSGDWKTLIVMNWIDDLQIEKNYVSGLEGNVQID